MVRLLSKRKFNMMTELQGAGKCNGKELSMNIKYTYRDLSEGNTAVLLTDHQSCPVNRVQGYSPDEFRNNVLTLADIANILGYTANKPD
ncbi:hypothetical protein [Candidatus Brocadia sapporoensis]|nr:hypothetical protein [Candidatus Brocadia sapporoensis]